MTFLEMLERGWADARFTCVGLDPRVAQIPNHIHGTHAARVGEFCLEIVDTCGELALAFKPNLAFYEALGSLGLVALKRICDHLKDRFPGAVLIADAKRGDIGSTNMGYVQMLEWLGVDAVTLNPYLGEEANRPFLDSGLGCIFLCKTSNSGSGEFQNLAINPSTEEVANIRVEFPALFGRYLETGGIPLYEYVAHAIATRWNKHGNCAVVVGATYPSELKVVREIVGRMPILVPGIGAQGGDLEAMVTAGLDDRGAGIIVNSSRGIIHAGKDQRFAQVAAEKTLELNTAINTVRDDVLRHR